MARISLAWQFVLAGAVVLVFGMVTIGVWVTARITETVTEQAATATALYVDSIIAPLTQELANASTLSPGARIALEETLQQGALSERMFAFKIWKPDGTIAYSNESALIGRRFGITEGLETARAGTVHAEFDALEGEENATERVAGKPLLEIYSPIREPWSGHVIGIAEFYEVADDLRAQLAHARIGSWLFVGAVTLTMLALLFVIVARGSRQIAFQSESLRSQVEDLRRLLDENLALRQRVEQAARRTAALNERYLRRLSAELHDGPAQLLAFASLRLGAITPAGPDAAEAQRVKGSLDEAMRDIRNICRGLTLPELDALDSREVLRRVVAAHESHAGTPVATDIGDRLPSLSQAGKICVYRFVQEALSNATRHAGGKEQRVTAETVDDGLQVAVSDAGPGFTRDASRKGLGLDGLEERIASLGGRFVLKSEPREGTRIAMWLPGETRP
ncbi:sensor histidine kinase [Ensifer soli]|uniref:sensor histidine kinase n=1 Tax=Ciceribacter sp. sgz301302 TaxID=3342379 RepID=UPI0035BA2137